MFTGASPFPGLHCNQRNPGRLLGLVLSAVGWAVTLQSAPIVRVADRQMVQDSCPAAVAGLTPTGKPAKGTRLNLAIGLPVRNPGELASLFRQIYDPASPEYHHYLTPEQFTGKFGPTEADYQSVAAFARAHGLQVTATHSNRLLLDVSGTVSIVESALHVTLHTYRHPTENRTFFAPDTPPSLDLATPILRISGLDDYFRPRAHFKTRPLGSRPTASPNAGSGPRGTYQGNDFRTAYVPGCALTGSGQVVGLLQFDGYNPADITYYESEAGLTNVALQNVLLDGFDGHPTYTGGEVEVTSDIEMVVSMAPGLSKVLVYEAGPNGDWHDLLNRMATDNLARQLSCSWYINDGPADPLADEIWQEMAMQGQSFFSASGDNDAWTGLISFPDDSPYITLVGGTTLTTTNGAWVSETVWNWGNGQGSGGGVSTQYPIPGWQTNISMTANQGSTTQRNTPDVALTADNIYVWADGTDQENLGGTSFAAPLWAGFAALVNQQAAAFGQPAIGFLNPALDVIGSGTNYAAGFHDIMTGDNENTDSPTQFLAVAGYDLCTGWGTPAGQKLIDALAYPEPLLITPATGFDSSGRVGGPFYPAAQSFSLTNLGTNSLTWSLVNTSAWLMVSSSAGTLVPGGPAFTLTVGLSANAGDLAAGTHVASVWFTNLNDQIGLNRQFSLTVISPSAITTQPVSQAVIEGESAAFTVAASGGLPLTYQWQENGTNLADGDDVSGSATTNLVINEVFAAELGNYSVVVTNLAGTVTSSNAVLSLLPSPPMITGQPANQTTVAGEPAVFTVAAVGSQPFACQWLFNGTNLPGATNATLTLAGVQPFQAGVYRVVLTNDYGSAVSSNATLSVYTVPFINAVSPGSGPAGTRVNIAGVNFSPETGGNLVYFGAVTAAVTAANATNLTVCVPAGATFAPVTETTGGQTAAAAAAFLPDFIGSGEFTNSSLDELLDLPTGNSPGPVVIADLDGDGRPDIIVGTGDHNLYIYQNISTNGTLSVNSFAPPVVMPLGNGSFAALQAADLTGDGKLDLVTADSLNNVVIVLKNLSTPGTITTNSFGPPVTFPCGAGATGVAAGDIDGDGRPEIVTANEGSNSVSVLLNLSTPGVITADSFAPAMDFTVGSNPNAVALADIDGDGKPDVVTVNSGDTGVMTVLRNLSTPGNLVFATNVVFQGLAGAYSIAVGDWDGDGKPDVMVGGQGSQVISVFRNTSAAGSITTNSFAPRVDFPAGGWVNSLAMGDLAGDGKPDLVAVVQQPSQMEVFLNTSAPGGLTSNWLSAPVVFDSDNAGSDPGGVAVGDLDGDGRPDIVFPNVDSADVSLYPNLMAFGGPPAIILQPASQMVDSGCSVTLTVAVTGALPLSCQWSLNRTNLAGETNVTLVLTNIQLSQTGDYAVSVTNALGSVLSSNALLTVELAPPVITDEPVSLTNLAGTAASFTVTAGGSLPQGYQWLQNGSELSDGGEISGSATTNLVLSNVQDADAANYAVVITNIAGSVTSSVASLMVLDLPAIMDQPTNETVLAGSTATFTVLASGTAPLAYQWLENGAPLTDGGTIFGSATSVLTLTDVGPADAADYSVEVTNLAGSETSQSATLTVDSPPTIASQPAGVTNHPGRAAYFAVTANGTAPLSYQWVFNGTNLAGATNSTLTLFKIQTAQAGAYSVWVTNPYGAILSSNAVLMVSPWLQFVWGQIPSPRFVNTPFAVVVQAQTFTNGISTNFTGTVTLLSTNGIPLVPAASANFIQGVWTGAVTVADTATNLVLRACDSLGDSGLANPINVINLPTLTASTADGSLLVAWPLDPPGFTLETTPWLFPADWVPVTNPPSPMDDQNVLSLPISGTNAFYRLSFPGP